MGINGISVFAYIDGLEDRPINLTVEGFDDWPVFTTLAPQNPPAIHTTNGSCENYYALTDSQIAMGPKLQAVKHTVKYKEVHAKFFLLFFFRVIFFVLLFSHYIF